MLDFLSNLVMRFRLKEKLKHVSSQSKEVNKAFNSLLILCNEDEIYQEKIFLKLAKQFGIKSQKVTLVVLSKKESEETKVMKVKTHFFSRKSVGFFGKLPISSTELFQERFDLQINFFNERSVFHELISVSCNSVLRVGFSKSNQQINDLILDIDLNQHKLFLKETERYLKAILN